MTTREVMPLTGPVYKLVSDKGTLLGTLTVPYRVAEYLERGMHCSFAKPNHFKIYRKPSEQPVLLNLSVGTLIPAYLPTISGAVRLEGLTLEEIEQIDGFAFSPGAGYLRSLIE